MGGRRTILVVEDEARVNDVVSRYLERDGFDVLRALDGLEGIRLGLEHHPDLVVLDLMLPGVDGLEVYKRLRAESRVPVIIVTALGDESDRIDGLEMGADDYLAKPFSPAELVARVKAVLRRVATSKPETDSPITAGDISIDQNGHVASVAGKSVKLTAREFDLLSFFVRNPRQVLSRGHLLSEVWGLDDDADPSTVTVHVRRLRTKIEADPMRPQYLKTVWGLGYRLDPGC